MKIPNDIVIYLCHSWTQRHWRSDVNKLLECFTTSWCHYHCFTLTNNQLHVHGYVKKNRFTAIVQINLW